MAACGAGTGLLGGCASEENPQVKQGFAADCEIKTYPVSLSLYADANLKWMAGGSAAAAKLGADGLTKLEEYALRYQNQSQRENVSISVHYVEPAQLATLVKEGFTAGDGIVAVDYMVSEGCAAETIDGGAAEYMVRDLSYNLSDRCVIVRKRGTTNMLPNAETIDGDDTPDGQINRLQQLPTYNGKIALANETVATEGVCANKVLANQQFYSNFDGRDGFYDESIASKLRVYPTQDAAMDAVTNGACQLGFAFRSSLNSHYPLVEECYNPQGGVMTYKAAALSRSPEPGVMRDFFAFIMTCTD